MINKFISQNKKINNKIKTNKEIHAYIITYKTPKSKFLLIKLLFLCLFNDKCGL
jgi:hypothetical protein